MTIDIKKMKKIFTSKSSEMMKGVLLIVCFIFTTQLAAQNPAKQGQPIISDYAQAMIATPPASLELDSFYKKYTDAYGIPVVYFRESS